MVVALTQVCELPIATAMPDQRDAKRQSVGTNAARHRNRRVVEQIHEIGVRAQITIERDRISLHRFDRVMRRRGGNEQHIDAVPHHFGLLAERAKLCLRVVEIGSAVVATLSENTAHGFDDFVFIVIEKFSDSGVALGDQRALVEQCGGVCQWRVINRDRCAAQRLQFLNCQCKRCLRQFIAKESERLWHTKLELRREGVTRQRQRTRIRIKRVVPH